jgi:preprotein translocase subunit SecE
MSMDMNREQKRQMKRMGALNEQGNPTRGQARTNASRGHDEPRTTPQQYLREVRSEMRKVAWPSWPEVRKYSIVVLVTVVVFTAFVFGLDSGIGEISSWLYG